MTNTSRLAVVPESPTSAPKPTTAGRRGAGAYKPRPEGSLKQATVGVLDRHGGARALCEAVGCSESILTKYGDAQVDRHIPVDKLHRLHQATDDAAILDWLALAMPTPRVVVEVEASRIACWYEHGQQVQQDVAQYMARLLDALKDGDVSPDEAGALKRDGMDIVRALVAGIAACGRIEEGQG